MYKRKCSTNSSVLYLGNFGGGGSVHGSQVKKTISIYEYLISKDIDITKINSDEFKSINSPIVFLRLIVELIKCDKLIVSLNKNGLRTGNYLLLKTINIFKKRNLFFITIGGWLPDFLIENKKIIKYLSHYNKIYVQADKIRNDLYDIGLENGINMQNFRDYDTNILNIYEQRIRLIDYNDNTIIKLVFFAFIRKDKGLDILVEAIKLINAKRNKKIFFLDIIGPVEKKYENEFNKILQDNTSICEYRGIIHSQDKIYESLTQYDFMAFPTFYDGEGFPTVIVESFISGVPVLASDWKYNCEIIKNGYNGLLFQTNNIAHLMQQLDFINENRHEIMNMRLNCLEEAKKFHPMLILEQILNDVR